MNQWTFAKAEGDGALAAEAPAVYNAGDGNGEATLTIHPVFPGVSVFYNDIHAQNCPDFSQPPIGTIEINYCHEGRFECEYAGGSVYLSAGDFSIHRTGVSQMHSSFPLGYYRGVSVLIDPDAAARCVNCILEDVSIDLNALFSRFLQGGPICMLKAQPCFQHIFSEMYSIPNSIKKGYLKIKVLELLLFLSGMRLPEKNGRRDYYTRTRVAAAKQAKQYLLENLDRRIPLTELCEHVNVSPTALKESFRSVYGSSIYAFVRAYKMQKAAVQIRQTDRAILHIAMDFGYENASKFSMAFRDVIGQSPQEYRKNCVRLEREPAEWSRQEG